MRVSFHKVSFIKYKNKYISDFYTLMGNLHISTNFNKSCALKFDSFRRAYKFIEFICLFDDFCFKDFEII